MFFFFFLTLFENIFKEMVLFCVCINIDREPCKIYLYKMWNYQDVTIDFKNIANKSEIDKFFSPSQQQRQQEDD